MYNDHGTVDWKTSCVGLCCHHACPLSLICPCAVYYKTSHLVEKVTEHRATCCESLLGGCCCCGGYNQRMMLREKYKLKGSVFTDFCMHLWCQCLALGQVYREARAWADAEPSMDTNPGTQAEPPQQQEMTPTDAVGKSKVGLTPTERYDELLVENALSKTNLGKKSSKTSTQMDGDQVLGPVVVRGDSFGSHDAKEAALMLMNVSSKALELHANFVGEACDSSKFLKTPTRGSEPGSTSGEGSTSAPGDTPAESANETEISAPAIAPPPVEPDEEPPLTETKSVADIGGMGKLVKAAGSGHYVVQQPQSKGEGGVLSLGQGDPRMNASSPAVPSYTSPPLVKSASGLPLNQTLVQGEKKQNKQLISPRLVGSGTNPRGESE